MDEPSVFDSWRSTVVLAVITGALASVLLAAENTATGGQAFWRAFRATSPPTCRS